MRNAHVHCPGLLFDIVQLSNIYFGSNFTMDKHITCKIMCKLVSNATSCVNYITFTGEDDTLTTPEECAKTFLDSLPESERQLCLLAEKNEDEEIYKNIRLIIEKYSTEVCICVINRGRGGLNLLQKF